MQKKNESIQHFQPQLLQLIKWKEMRISRAAGHIPTDCICAQRVRMRSGEKISANIVERKRPETRHECLQSGFVPDEEAHRK